MVLKRLAQGVGSFLQEDLDTLFSYHTRRQIEVKYLWLGILEKCLQACVAFYVVFGVFYMGESYYERDESPGLIATAVTGGAMGMNIGGAHGLSRYFSADEILGPALENGNVFLTTKLDIEQQVRGVCEDVSLPCDTAADCSKGVGATCSQDGFCIEPAWCPVSDSDMEGETYKLNLEDLNLWVKSAVSFTLAERVYSQGFDAPVPFPRRGFNTFTVKDLLLYCNPPVRFEEVSELGAAIEVQFVWECVINDFFDCKVKQVKARRIDMDLESDTIGFKYKQVTPTGPDTRELQYRSGIRIYFRTVGYGAKVSMAEIILKFSTGLSLVALVPVITDFVMLKFCKLKKKFQARKYTYSVDFGDAFAEHEGDTGFCGIFAWSAASKDISKELQSFLEGAGDEMINQLEMEDEQWKSELLEEDDLLRNFEGRGRV